MNASPERYSSASIILHWMNAAAIFAAIPLGISLEHAPAAWTDTLYRLHWSFGLMALAIVFCRMANRAGSKPPAAYASLTRLEFVLSSIIHRVLYILLLIVPTLGWAGKSAYGGKITVFGLFDMPAILTQNTARGEQILAVHGIAAKLLILCIILHVVGALNHALIKRDGVLRRMLPAVWFRQD